MHWLIRIMANAFNIPPADEIIYISFAIVISILIVFAIHFILFTIIVVIFLKAEHPLFEYSLRRTYLKAITYIIICFLLSAEIVACWHFAWVENMNMFIPLWIGFITGAIMAVMRAYPFSKRFSEIKQIEKKLRKA